MLPMASRLSLTEEDSDHGQSQPQPAVPKVTKAGWQLAKEERG